jgi:hypothetical protein
MLFLVCQDSTKKEFGGTGIRARVKRITTAYANHYTIPPLHVPQEPTKRHVQPVGLEPTPTKLTTT